MTIRAMLGFAHLPKKDSYGAAASGYGLALSGLTFSVNNAYVGSNFCYVDDDAIRMITGTNAFVILSIQPVGLSDFTSPKTIIGFRYSNTGYYDNTFSIGGVGLNFTELGIALNGTNYIEVVCDRVAKEISYFVNSEFKLKKSVSTVPFTANQALTFQTPSQAGANFTLKDFYVIDDTQDDTPCTRLGPVTVRAIDVTEVTGDGWVASNAAPLSDVIKTPYTDVASVAAPVVSSPESLVPLLASLAGLADNAANIKGVMFSMASRRVPASAVGIDIGVKAGDVTVVGATTRYTTDAVTYSGSGVFNKAPDGGLWTNDKIKAVKAVIKPKPV